MNPFWWVKRYAKTETPWWMHEASLLQKMGTESEGTKDWDNYDSATVRRSIIYTRQDLILVVSLLNSANVQLDTATRHLRWIKFGIWIAAAALIYLCIRVS